MKKVTERDVEQYLVSQVEQALHGRCIKMSPQGQSGWPDRVILFPHGRTAFAELKCDGGVVSKIQKERIKELRAMGFEAWILWSRDDVDFYINYLKGLR